MRHHAPALALVVALTLPLCGGLSAQQPSAPSAPAGQGAAAGAGRTSTPGPGQDAPPGRARGANPGANGVVGGVGAPPAAPAGPAPRRADGSVTFGAAKPGEKGVWLPQDGGFMTMVDPAKVPYQPWARALVADREKNQLEPHTRCKPSGVARPFLTPYGVEIVDLPDIQRVFIFDIGGPHTYRTIYTDRRIHPDRVDPSYYGHSVGWWEGDTLIVDTIGFNEGFWMDRRGTPHTDKLHTIERLTRTDSRTIKYDLTIEDPGALTSSYQAGFNLKWEADTELFEYVCQQGNYADTLMLGEQKSVDRTSNIVP